MADSPHFPYNYRSRFSLHAAMVQRLARSPFKAKIRVRFPLAVPESFANTLGKRIAERAAKELADLTAAHPEWKDPDTNWAGKPH
jgi:hypothetical protein